MMHFATRGLGVIAVGHADHANPPMFEAAEGTFCLDNVPSEAGNIIYEQYVELPRLGVAEHRLVTPTVSARARGGLLLIDLCAVARYATSRVSRRSSGRLSFRIEFLYHHVRNGALWACHQPGRIRTVLEERVWRGDEPTNAADRVLPPTARGDSWVELRSLRGTAAIPLLAWNQRERS